VSTGAILGAAEVEAGGRMIFHVKEGKVNVAHMAEISRLGVIRMI